MDLVNMKLTSPNHPKAYDPLEQCTWNITAHKGHYVTLDFVTIDVSNTSIPWWGGLEYDFHNLILANVIIRKYYWHTIWGITKTKSIGY